MLKHLRVLIHERIILPITASNAPVAQLSWGVAVGMFVGLTPTMGVQMYLAAMIWAVSRYILQFPFNLPVAVALVWITNPITVVPIYYVFLATGSLLLQNGEALNYAHFAESFERIAALESAWDSIVEGTRFLLVDLGWPMVVGGLAYAIPGAILGYFLTFRLVTRHRRQKALAANMGYEQWQAINEVMH